MGAAVAVAVLGVAGLDAAAGVVAAAGFTRLRAASAGFALSGVLLRSETGAGRADTGSATGRGRPPAGF